MTPSLVRVVATQDLDCVDRAKFRYALPTPVDAALLGRFGDCDIRVHAFSRFSPRARDLVTIVRGDTFRCDGIVGAAALVVAFAGDAIDWPVAAMQDFADRLAQAGCGAVEYRRGADPGCATCTARFVKRCRGSKPPFHPGKGPGLAAMVDVTKLGASQMMSPGSAPFLAGVVRRG